MDRHKSCFLAVAVIIQMQLRESGNFLSDYVIVYPDKPGPPKELAELYQGLLNIADDLANTSEESFQEDPQSRALFPPRISITSGI